ncbi:MAG: DNA-binding protein HU [Bacteroidetes bacterium ADurb.BinA174]|nr:MAG: DNA-binding protein HU [Bacteroidetes bacterium ADurb.BinA174]
MENKITLSDLIDLLAVQANISNSESEVFLKSLFEIITETLAKDEVVKIKDFGTFKLTPIQARESVDVNTGEKIEIPAHNRLSFSPATALKELVNKPFSHFETILLNEGVSFEGVEEEIETNENEDIETSSEQTIEFAEKIEEIEEAVFAAEPKITVGNTKVVSPETPTLETDSYQHVFRSDKTVPTKPQKRSKIPSVWIPILGGIAIALASLFFFVQWQTRRKPIIIGEKQPVIENIPQQIIPVEEKEPQRKEPEVVVLSGGETLRILAEEKFGNREFWIYIYLKNKSKIKNPNIVSVGTELIIPDLSEYDINASNPQSVAKAKALGDNELKRF